MKKSIFSFLIFLSVLFGLEGKDVQASSLQEDLTPLETVTLFLTSLSPVKVEDISAFKVFCVDQSSQLRKKPVAYVAKTVSSIIKKMGECPLETATFLVTGTGLSELLPYVDQVIQGAEYLKIGARIYPLISDRGGQDYVQKGLKIATIAAAVYAFDTLPAAAALKYGSAAEAQAAYNGGPCVDRDIVNTIRCIDAGGQHDMCLRANNLPVSTATDEYFFTRHMTSSPDLDPVSITSIGDYQTCIQTALTERSPVTEICFLKTNGLESRTIRTLDQITLSRAQAGLESGSSAHHSAVQTGFFTACGMTKVVPTVPISADVIPTCLLSAPGPQDDVTKICFDPQNPAMPVVTRLEVVEKGVLVPVKGHEIMIFKDSKPHSVVYEEGAPLPSVDCASEKMSSSLQVVMPRIEEVSSLETALERVVSESSVSYGDVDLEPVAPAALAPYQNTLSLWGSVSGALKCWYYGINPCVLKE